jgi:glutamate racemase
VLGVIRPAAEAVGQYTRTGHVGILGTVGTVQSLSYPIEIKKLHPHIQVFQEACPMWVSLVENGEHCKDGADYFIRQHIDHLLHQSADIDAIVLACTHYPLLIDKIKKYVPSGVRVLSTGGIVAESLADYLHRHPEMDNRLGKNGVRLFQTTDSPEIFDRYGSDFFGEEVKSNEIVFVMGPEPNKSRGATPDRLPYPVITRKTL